MKSVASLLERAIFGSRWVLMPFLVGLVIGILALLVKFVLKLVDFVGGVFGGDASEVLVGMLGLVDLTLTANLVVIVICSTYDNFVAAVGDHPEWPQGLVKIGFWDLKQRVLGSIVAIAAVSTLEWFVDIDRNPDSIKLGWVVGILLAFAVTVLLLAVADRFTIDHKEH